MLQACIRAWRTHAAKVGMEANREALKKRVKHLHQPGGVVGVIGSAASVGLPPEGHKSNTSGSNVAGPCHHAVVMCVVWSHAMMDHATILCRDVCHVVPCHDRPRHHAVLVYVMSFHAM